MCRSQSIHPGSWSMASRGLTERFAQLFAPFAYKGFERLGCARSPVRATKQQSLRFAQDDSSMTSPRYPLSATYRVQLNKQFTLNDARAIVPYLDRLGISHLYCSPVLAARPGSTHGYDVIDPTRVNPEIGTI